MSKANRTVYIVDDDPSVLTGLSRLVRSAGMQALPFRSAEEFLRSTKAPFTHPACLVLDLQMPGISGLDLQQHLRRHPAQCPIIFISGNADIPSTVRAMKHGAITFLQKPFDDSDLLQALQEALKQHEQVLKHQGRQLEIQRKIDSLTEREREVMSWVITGALNKQIAAGLGIVEQTVKVHRARVLEKMEVTSVAELVRLCHLVDIAPAE